MHSLHSIELDLDMIWMVCR